MLAVLAKPWPGSCPDESIEVRQSGSALVLTGEVGSEAEQKQAEAVAKTLRSRVVNMLAIRENREVVLLQVKIAEVDRSTLERTGDVPLQHGRREHDRCHFRRSSLANSGRVSGKSLSVSRFQVSRIPRPAQSVMTISGLWIGASGSPT